MSAIDKKKRWVRVALGSAILAGITVWFFLHHLEATYQEAGEMSPVLVAARYIPGYSTLGAALFQKMQIPKIYAAPGAISDFDVLESSPGRPRFRNILPMPGGTQLVQRELAPIAQDDALSQIIPDNQAAVSFGVDSIRGLGGNVQPGDLIDILQTSKGKAMDPASHLTTLLFQSVPVIAVGKKWTLPGRATTPDEKNKEEKLDKENDEAAVLTVLLNPLAAIRLAESRENETLSVILRAPGDTRTLEARP